MLIRFVIWGLLGWCMEVVWTALLNAVQRRDWSLPGVTYLWMFPIYGLLGPLYEPFHDFIREWPLLARAALYSCGFTLIEFSTGWIIGRLTGRCPWDYVAGKVRFAINPYIRWDYFPLWAAVGLALEPVHDFLVRLTPAIEAALRG